MRFAMRLLEHHRMPIHLCYRAEHLPSLPGHSTHSFGTSVHGAVDKTQRQEIFSISTLCTHAQEGSIWLKMVMNCLIPGLHCTDITRDRVCLVYALMTNSKLNIGAIIKSTMQKFRVHKGHGMHLEVLLLTSVIVQVYQKKI